MEDDKQSTAVEIPEVKFDEFAATTYDEWKGEAITSLKGGIFEKKLFTKTYEGIKLEPIYTREHTKNLEHPRSYPGTGSFLRGTKTAGYITSPWEIAQACDEAMPGQCNELLKHELAKGSTCLHVALDTATQSGMDADAADTALVGDKALSISTLKDFNELFKGIDVTKQDVHINAGCSNVMMLGLMGAFLTEHGFSLEKAGGCIGADPIDFWTRRGSLPCPLDELYDEMAHTAAWAAEHMPRMRTILVRGEAYHNGGASAVQETAYAMAAAITYIRAMRIRGLDIDTIAPQIRFSFSLGSNFFMEIAKLRAARMIWAQIVEAFGGSQESQKINLYTRTSYFTKTVFDPYVNMLRTTTEAFSGVVGGTDGLQIGCFDEPVRLGDEFSRRISRNTQIMLQNEFNLRQPVDPAGGSWYIETLTNQLAEKVWALLQTIEEQGGIVALLKTGLVQKAVAETLQQRFKNLATRADRAVGTNMYPNVKEQPLEVPQTTGETVKCLRSKELAGYRASRDRQQVKQQCDKLLDSISGSVGGLIDTVISAVAAGATLGSIREILNDGEVESAKIQPIAVHRWTEQFEALRQRTEAYRAKTGDNVKVFLANMGKIPQHKPRADFTTGFIEVGAFEVIKNDGFPTVEEASRAAVQSGADAAVICSTDDTYPELVPPLAKLIKQQCPAMKVILAGAPAPEYEAIYREAGVDFFIHVRANCYEILTDLQRAKGMF
ncbi:MAG: methylmalonyl-CoA mutase family protein [Veillonellales bacterium]